MFFKKSIHEPVEKQLEEVKRSASGPFGELLLPKYVNGLDCDQLPMGKGAFGGVDNPIPVNGLIGEIKYLAKLRGKTGESVMFHRVGSMNSGATDDPVDCYEIVCMDGTQWTRLHFDCYHPRRSNLCPRGFSLVPFDKKMGMDIPFGFGTNSLVEKFPLGLPEAIIRFFGESPGRAFARRVEERLQRYRFVRGSE